MPLTLTVRTVDRAGAAVPPPLRLDRRGAIIGRSTDADLTLPDARNTVSSRHCEIAFRDGAYLIADSSTNGTYVNGGRLAGAHRIGGGDVIGIGPYELIASLSADVGAMPAAPAGPAHATAAQPAGGAAVDHLLRAAGLRRADVRGGDAEILAAAGTLLVAMTTGMAMLLDRRTQARAQLGAAPDPAGGAGPLGNGGAPALAALLGDAAAAARTTGAAFGDLERHQLAMLKAMQGAMTATLARIAPAAIRTRAGVKASDGALWQEYERAFAGTDQARDDAFIEIFAREFRAAYEELAARR